MDKQKIIFDILYSVMSSDDKEICCDSELNADLGISSFDLIQVVYDVETRFAMEISDEELEKIKRVQDLIDIVSDKQGG